MFFSKFVINVFSKEHYSRSVRDKTLITSLTLSMMVIQFPIGKLYYHHGKRVNYIVSTQTTQDFGYSNLSSYE